MNRQSRVEGARRSGSKRPSRTVEATPTRRKGSAKAEKTSAKSGAGKSGKGPSLDKDEAAANDEAAAPAAGGLMGKLFPPRPTDADGRPTRPQPVQSVVVDLEEDPGGWRGAVLRASIQPGGRPAILALIAGIVCAGVLVFGSVLPQASFDWFGGEVVRASGAGDAAIADFEDADPVVHYRRLLDVLGPVGTAVFAVVPLGITVMAVRSLSRPTRSRTLLISAITAAIFVFMTQAIGIYFLVGAGALGWAAFKSRKADQQAALAG